MSQALSIFHIIISISLVVLVLIQARGTGFGRGMGGTSFTRRGLEKLVFRLTFVVAALFIILSVLMLVL